VAVIEAAGKHLPRRGVFTLNVSPTTHQSSSTPDLDRWLPDPAIRVAHRRESSAPPDQLWEAAQSVRLSDTRLLGRLVRWRIPGLPPDLAFDELFRSPPFLVLAEEPSRALVSGLVGRIWTLRRDYPQLEDPEEFRAWDTSGTARVVFANWIETESSESESSESESSQGRSAIRAEARVEPIGAQGRVGVAAVRGLVSAFGSLIGSDGIEIAARRAERS
jgi:hypothetical protein